ncbi:MAG: hypothetical protein WCK51_03035 [Armatimonadota bacterium]
MFIGVIVVIVFAMWSYGRKEQARSDSDSAMASLRQKPNDSTRYIEALQAADELADRTRPNNSDRDTWRRSVRNEVELIRLQSAKAALAQEKEAVEARLRKQASLYERTSSHTMSLQNGRMKSFAMYDR